jgi:HK97 family phage major capsid protein
MALKANELRHKAKRNQARMQEILNSSTEALSKEQEEEFDKLDADAEKFLKQADKIEKMQSREIQEEAEQAEELSNQPKKEKSIADLKPEELKKAEDIAMRSYLKTGIVPVQLRALMPVAQAEKDDKSMIEQALKEMGFEGFAAQSTTTSGGGYTIARGFQAQLEKALLEYGGMWESSRIIKTSQGNVMDWPTVNDTANKAYLLAESGNSTTSAQAVAFGQQQFEAYKYTSGLIQVPTELLEDSEFDVSALMVELLAERIWRGTNEAFTTADGSSKPKGLTVAAAYAGSTADDAALAFDDIIKLEHSVDPAYRKNAKFMFHDSVLQTLKKLKDGQNLPIWNPALLQNGAPGKILGYDYVINQDMASYVSGSTTANDNDKVMLFGDLKKYIIRQVRSMRIVRLNERFGELDQTGFVVFFRVDGDLLNGGTNPVKYLRSSAT